MPLHQVDKALESGAVAGPLERKEVVNSSASAFGCNALEHEDATRLNGGATMSLARRANAETEIE